MAVELQQDHHPAQKKNGEAHISPPDWRQECETFTKGLKPLQESSRTQGVIPQLRPHFVSLNKKGKTSTAYLCSPDTDHVATGLTDLGWGCGYRNCQMLMTFLSRQREQNEPVIEGVANISGLQMLLEKAWKEGFDPEGAAQLNHRVHKTRKWIGTTEVFSILSYLGIRCTILDFDRPTGNNNSHDAMFDWVQSYFEESIEAAASSGESEANQDPASKPRDRVVNITNRPPIYLQHAGHSRTVIGIEKLPDGRRNLIMFDPGRRMARSYKRNVSMPEDDMYNSGLLSLNDDEESTAEGAVGQDATNGGLLSRLQQLVSVPPSNLLRPFRVDSQTIAKNRQYQLLVLGEVNEIIGSHGNQFRWNESKPYTLCAEEREQHKRVGSYRVV